MVKELVKEQFEIDDIKSQEKWRLEKETKWVNKYIETRDEIEKMEEMKNSDSRKQKQKKIRGNRKKKEN